MKCLAVVTVLCLVCAFERASAGNQKIKETAEQCQVDTGASDKDLENISNGISPSTPEEKCLSACIAKKHNIMTEDNKLSPEMLMLIVAMKTMGDADLTAKFAEVAEACSEVTDDDECEAAFLIWECVKNESSARGLESL